MGKMVFSKFFLAAVICAVTVPVLGDELFMDPTNIATGMKPSDFVWDASLINLEEIRLGQVAQSKSQNAAVQEFGKHMVRDHTRLNERLTKIAASEGLLLPDTNTFVVPVQQPPEEKEATELTTTTGTPAERMLNAQLDAQHLESLSGTDFDHAYADAMVTGHQKAAEKFQSAEDSLQDDQLKRYAERGLRVIRSHYDMALKLEAALQPTNAPAGMTNSASHM